MCDKHQVIEEPCEAKVSRTVLESGGSREKVADFNSCCGCLGSRYGDAFYCRNFECGVVLQADWNAAVNIKSRKDDPEIGRWTAYTQVKSILLERSRQRLGLLNQDSRCLEGAFVGDNTSGQSERKISNVGQF
jgi:hypothetical protein